MPGVCCLARSGSYETQDRDLEDDLNDMETPCFPHRNGDERDTALVAPRAPRDVVPELHGVTHNEVIFLHTATVVNSPLTLQVSKVNFSTS